MDVSERASAAPQPDASSTTTFTIADLKRAKVWLCGRTYGPKGEKTNGQPLNARTGEPASSTDPDDRDTYEVAAATAERLGLHVGLAMGPIPGTPYTLVSNDIDQAQSGGKLKLFARRMVDASAGMLGEVSRGQKGLHHYGIALTKDIETLGATEWTRKVALADLGLEFYVHGQFLIAPGWTWPRREGVLWWDDASAPVPLVGREQLLKIHAVMEKAAAQPVDIYLAALKRQSLYKSMGKKGRVNIHCPWRGEHSDGENETECIYWPVDDKRKKPGFNCKHTHCDGKRHIKDLNDWLKEKDPQFKEDLAAWAREEREARRAQGVAGDEFYEAMLGQKFLNEHGEEFLYIEERKHWKRWTGTHWRQEKTKLVKDLIKGIAIAHGPPSRSGTKMSHVSGAEEAARIDRKAAREIGDFDSNIHLFNHAGGTLDCRTGETYPHRRPDLVTKCATAKPEGDCPLWIEFLDTIMAGDAEMISFIQRTLGYMLTGETSERAFFYLHGEGANGKTVFLETIAAIMGSDYAKRVTPTVLMVQRHEPHPTGLADLEGARFAYASELPAGQTLNIEVLKQLAGEDAIKARRMREDPWEYWAQLTLFFAANNKPTIRQVDKAIMERMNLIPFKVVIPREKRDRQLRAKLLAERNGILNWMVQGLADWQRIGLQPPDTVRAATKTYFDEQDTIGNWMAEECEVDKENENMKEGASDLYRSFRQCCEAAGEFVISQKHFSLQMQARGFKADHTRSGNVFRGIKLRGDRGASGDAGGGSKPGDLPDDPFE
jgi:P4 family phage/plasmid primase-like protien